MEEAGLVMAEHGARVTEDCKQLWKDIRDADFALPENPLFQKERLLQVLDRVRFRNEARVVRDITPVIVPSAELLHIDGHQDLPCVTESMNAQWDNIATLCGPMPKPDFVGGISPSAFTADQREKLKMHHTAHCPNLFPESMYYPFLICEVKSSDKPIREAERQAMHSASIAANAIVQLYKKISQAHELNHKILTVSVSHNNTTVKVYGHFARVEDDKITFFRHRIYEANFAADLAEATEADEADDADDATLKTYADFWKAYKIIRGTYRLFFPKHLERITSAVSKLRDRALESFTSQLELGGGVEGASSQGTERFKKPSLPPSSKIQQQNDKLLALLEQQRAEQREQKEMMERQMEQQKAEQREQKEMMERQMEQQKAEQREQKEMMERQMEQQRQQMEQQKEMISLLKQSNK
jgi:hypothetical protein